MPTCPRDFEGSAETTSPCPIAPLRTTIQPSTETSDAARRSNVSPGVAVADETLLTMRMGISVPAGTTTREDPCADAHHGCTIANTSGSGQ
jgi:hypothetical protein